MGFEFADGLVCRPGCCADLLVCWFLGCGLLFGLLVLVVVFGLWVLWLCFCWVVVLSALGFGFDAYCLRGLGFRFSSRRGMILVDSMVS